MEITSDNDKEKKLIEGLARRIRELGLRLPALIFLEVHRPLSNLFYNTSIFFEPIAAPFFGLERYTNIKTVLAKRANIERLIALLDKDPTTDK
ncbi:MAG: hypothetical protein IT292_08685 [Deltaproteobacteria bacterium]|nr:hypothetical protein [Deltaproteobacteria bacterium]